MTGRIAFYAPLKPPDHPNPSGDRRFAQLLIDALRAGGFTVEVASSLRTRNATGDNGLQDRLEAAASKETADLISQYRSDPPVLWFTYHNYYKAPDLIGPTVSGQLGIPYVLAEASHAPPREQGAWARGAALSDAAILRADLILQPNPKDWAGVQCLGAGERQQALPPFLDAQDQAAERPNRAAHREHFARRLGLDPETVWAVATAMMRFDTKRKSYLVLADAAARLPDGRFSLILVGDGPARADIETAFANQNDVRFAGLLSAAEIICLNAAADIFVWPALGEAFGMALLEAQAAGLPAVVGDRPGTRAILRPDETGILTTEGDPVALADAMRLLINDSAQRARMAEAAAVHVRASHDITSAAAFLNTVLSELIAGRRVE